MSGEDKKGFCDVLFLTWLFNNHNRQQYSGEGVSSQIDLQPRCCCGVPEKIVR
jgi:hypothetical protein